VLPPKVIMSPIDFSEPSSDALKEATELAVCFKSELLLVNIVPAIPKLPSPGLLFSEREYEEALHKNAVDKLDAMIRTIGQRGVTARSAVGTANDVSGELLRIAEHNAVDLIVIATHGISGWRRLAFGSVAEKVVRLASCPVLLLRAQQADEQTSQVKGEAKAVAQ
jgi:nucleotide-binding universal stress UspA family protein